MIEKVRTLTLFTHVQPQYDVDGASKLACEKLIHSGRAGQILEHRVSTYDRWLEHQGRVWLTRSWQVPEETPVPD